MHGAPSSFPIYSVHRSTMALAISLMKRQTSPFLSPDNIENFSDIEIVYSNSSFTLTMPPGGFGIWAKNPASFVRVTNWHSCDRKDRVLANIAKYS